MPSHDNIDNLHPYETVAIDQHSYYLDSPHGRSAPYHHQAMIVYHSRERYRKRDACKIADWAGKARYPTDTNMEGVSDTTVDYAERTRFQAAALLGPWNLPLSSLRMEFPRPAMGMSGVWSDEEGAVYDNVIRSEPSRNTMLPAVDGFVPQAPPCASGVVDNMLYHTGSHMDVDDWPSTVGQRDASHCPLSISNGSWLSGPPPHQEGVSFPSAGPACCSAFMQQHLHYTAPEPKFFTGFTSVEYIHEWWAECVRGWPRGCSTDGNMILTHVAGPPSTPQITNRGMAWTTTATPPAANLASVQLAGASTRRPDTAPSPTMMATRIICRKPFDANRTRHWINEHVTRELEDIQRGYLDVSRATILKSDAGVLWAEGLVVVCPYGCKNLYNQPKAFSRQLHLLRHFRGRCREKLDDKRVKAVAEKQWTSKRGPDVFTKVSWRRYPLKVANLAHIRSSEA
ncbi:hypothetical protein JB92DRAFT_3099172 [Gautieria morchelliformis]|nr:hypothetical protein JB92DRAFT_3099172 [Gautieria morchelliformis]